MLTAIHVACSKHSPNDFKNFLKVIKGLYLNGVVDPFWLDWAQSDPCNFITVEPLHHFHQFAWDHDVKWCITVVGAKELDFRFSVIQNPVGYRRFEEGISRLKQVTGWDHHAVQRNLIGVIAGRAPRKFIAALRALLDFRYLAQAPVFTTYSLDRVANALQEFHQNKDAIIQHGARDGWQIPKLELLQSGVPGIRQSGAAMQWTADITEHKHVEEIKVPTRAGNNQNYYSQIARHLDRLDKCFCFDLAMYIEEHNTRNQEVDEGIIDDDEYDDHEPGIDNLAFDAYHTPGQPTINYFSISSTLLQGPSSSAIKPFRTFATMTTMFHLADKLSSRLTVAEASIKYGLPDLAIAISAVSAWCDGSSAQVGSSDTLQIWQKLRVQQMSYHNPDTVKPPQTLCIIPPSPTNPFGKYDSVILSSGNNSDWPKHGLVDHSVAQLRIVFRLPRSEVFLAYVQRIVVGNVNPATGMHHLKQAV